MLNKMIKRRQQRRAPPSSSSSSAGYLTVNHASRLPATAPQISTPAAAPPPTAAAVEVLPPLRDVGPSDRHDVFVKKLRICCLAFDFSDAAAKSLREKEIKSQTLAELVDFLQSSSRKSLKMNEAMQGQLVEMISLNIFRCLPPATHENTASEWGGVDPEDDEVFMDPSWPHLQIVYELLLKYVISPETDTKIARKYVDHSFVLNLIDLFDSEDARERECLKTIVHRIYGRFMAHRPFIRSAISNTFYRFIFETQRHSGIAELLEILGSVINGFALPMKEEHKLFLARALIPLHKPPSVASYHQQLSYCVTLFVEKDSRLAETVIRGLLKYWPVTNSGKEVLFIGELEEVLDVIPSEEFKRCMIPLFRRIGRCINSSHCQVAERALFLWNNERVSVLIGENQDVILPIVFEAVERSRRGHWNKGVVGLSSNVRRMLMEMDGELFESCDKDFREREAGAVEVEGKREMNWKKLEEMAA
ncbi:hypothetical protein M569_14139, partial [Genlisea aurea]